MNIVKTYKGYSLNDFYIGKSQGWFKTTEKEFLVHYRASFAEPEKASDKDILNYFKGVGQLSTQWAVWMMIPDNKVVNFFGILLDADFAESKMDHEIVMAMGRKRNNNNQMYFNEYCRLHRRILDEDFELNKRNPEV